MALTAQDMVIAEQRAAGRPMQDIAQSIGCHHSTVSRRLSKSDLKTMVEDIQERTISQALPQAADNITHVIEVYRTPKHVKDDAGNYVVDEDGERVINPEYPDSLMREHGYRASVMVLQSVGILPSHTQSVVYQQINAAGDVHVSAEVDQLHSFLSSQMSNIIDVEPDDDTP
jgi:hypothetical protein